MTLLILQLNYWISAMKHDEWIWVLLHLWEERFDKHLVAHMKPTRCTDDIAVDIEI